MKKVVQSRWKGYSLSASQASTLGQFSSRCRFAIDRGAFSDIEVSSALRESDEPEPSESYHQQTQNAYLAVHKSRDFDYADEKRFQSSKPADYAVPGTRYPRRARSRLAESRRLPTSDVKPKEKYCELIADVFRSERKAQMKKADIVARIKSRLAVLLWSSARMIPSERDELRSYTRFDYRYPYFKNLRKFECRISEVLTRNPAFKLIGPGTWAYLRLDCGNGQGSRVRKRLRARRRPDFLRLEWKTPGHGAKRNLSRPQSSQMDTSTESEDESAKPETSFSSSLSIEDQTTASTTGKDSVAGENKTEIDICKEALADFNKEMLKRAIEEITKANQKCFESLNATMTATQCTSSSTNAISDESNMSEGIRKNNQQLLQETIDKLIADNEKCLMDLNQSTAECGISSVPNFGCQKSQSYDVIKSTSIPARSLCVTTSTMSSCIKASNCSKPKTVSVASDSDKLSKVQKRDDRGIPYPLPTILKHNIKVNNHIKFGKRVIPRLNNESPADNSAKNVSQSESSGQDDSKHRVTQVVPGPKKRLVDLRPYGMKTISPSSNSTKKIRLSVSVDSSKDPAPSKSALENNQSVSEKSDHVTNVVSKKSVSDVFAEYARRNSEFKDIIAMIDPTLSNVLDSQDRQILTPKPTHKLEKNDSPGPPVANPPGIIPDLSHQNTSTVEVKLENTIIQVRPSTSNKEKSGLTSSQETTPPSTSTRHPDTFIDVQLAVGNNRAMNYPLSRANSSGILTSNSNHPIQLSSSTEKHPRPLIRPIPLAAQAYTTLPQRRVHSNMGIDIRYIPPYRWRPAGATQQNREANRTFAPGGVHSYHVLYPGPRPGTYSSRSVRPQLELSSAVPFRRGNALNDVRCRIRGATVLRFPVRK